MKTKRIVAWLLTFLMVLGVMPARVVMADSALVDAETKLKDGEYIDKVKNGKVKVKDGKLSCTIKKGATVVIY